MKKFRSVYINKWLLTLQNLLIGDEQFMIKWLQSPILLSKVDVYIVMQLINLYSTATFLEVIAFQKIVKHKSRKDRCNLCIAYNLGHKEKKRAKKHQKKKKEARKKAKM